MRFRYSLKVYFLTYAVITIAFAYAARYYLGNDYRPIAPLGMWQGKFKTPDPLNKLPPTRIITTHGNWVKTWSILRSGEPLPNVDFQNEFICVCRIDGPNKAHFVGGVNGLGDARRIGAFVTFLGGNEYRYKIWKISREGLRTIDGIAVEVWLKDTARHRTEPIKEWQPPPGLLERLERVRAKYAAVSLHPEADEKSVKRWERKKAELLEELQQLEHELETIKAQLPRTDRF